MKHFKKGLFFISLLIFIIGLSNFAYAENDDDHTVLADYLKQMGLFLGSDIGYELDKMPTRAQAAVMVVRLLGKEDEALALNSEHPFTDVPDWASPYVGYLYVNGISIGISSTLYGSDDLVNASQYMTFMLRILSYDDLAGDFSWKESIQKAYDINILTQEELILYQSKTDFIRDDLVVLTYNSLSGELKDGKGMTLLKKLWNEQVVPKNAMIEYIYAPYKIVDLNAKPNTVDEFKNYFFEAVIAYQDSITIDISLLDATDLSGLINNAVDGLVIFPGYASVVSGWHAKLAGSELTIDINYLISKDKYAEAVAQANLIAEQLIDIGVSDYDNELLIHDYIIDNTIYFSGTDIKPEVYTIYGTFVDHEAVCQGYADAFFYLTACAGIDSFITYGVATVNDNDALHAWNIVKLEDAYYQVDITWDDPITADGTDSKIYDYFNLTDEEIFNDHKLDTNTYPKCDATKYNYYVYNNLIVHGLTELKEALAVGLSDGKNDILFKVVDEAVDTEVLGDILQSINGYQSCSYSVSSLGVVYIYDILY